MILDDIFEAMKPSDIPTSMRTNRLTMRDIEKERPQGAYRFRVGDNEFMDLDAAREFARGTGETVKPIGQSTPTGAQAKFRVIDPRDNRPAATFANQRDAEAYAGTVNGRVEAIRETVKKKLGERDSRSSARIERILKQLRARHPQAQDDLEALVYDFRSQQGQDRQDISRLDAENDSEEAAIDELQAMIDDLRRRRGITEADISRNGRSILAESCQGLTRPQRLIVEGIYNDFKPLLMLEAELTANQIQQLFVTTQKNAGRTLVGKGIDAASTVNQAIDKVGKWLQDTTPVKMADEKFAQLKTKISAKFPELDKTLTGWGTWMKENPGKSAAIIGILTTIAALGGGPAGGAIAGQILRGTAELLKGEKISTAVGKGVKTAALGALAGYTIDQIGDLISGGARIVADNIFPGATRLRMNFDVSGTGASTFQNVTAVGRPDDIQAVRDMFNGAAKAWGSENYQQALSMFDKARDMAQQLADPKYVAALTSDREMAQTIMAQAKNLVAATDAVAAGAQGAVAGTVGNKSNAQPTNEYIDLDLTHRAWTLNESLGRHRGGVHLNQHGIDTLFALVINEGPLDLLKRGAAAVGGAIKKGAQAVGAKASQIGQSITNKTTADALNKAWTKAGKPTDHNKVAAVLRSAGVKDDVIKNSFGELKLPAPQMSAAPSAAAGNVAAQAADSASVGQGQTAAAKKQTGGRVAGAGLSQTPNAIRKRAARAAEKTTGSAATKAVAAPSASTPATALTKAVAAPSASTSATASTATPGPTPATADTTEPSVLASKPVFGDNPFQQPAPIRTKDPITGKQIEPEYTPSEVPPQYADYQSNLARYMAKYGQPAAATAPTPATTPAKTAVSRPAKAAVSKPKTAGTGQGVDFGRMVSQLAAPQGTPTSTGGTVQPTSTGLIHRAKSPAAPTATPTPTPTAAKATGTQTLSRSDRPAWLGKPITTGGQTIKPTDPNYKKVADALLKQGITEKKRPVPTNKPLWGRAKAAARSKFDVYPSAYANAWAAKWYKSHGGGWRMGKGAKK